MNLTERLRGVSWTNVVMAVVVFWMGTAIGGGSSPGGNRTRVDTVTVDQYRDSLEALKEEVGGLRGRVRGREEVEPTVITRVDTLVLPPDTVYEVLTIREGHLSVGVLSRQDSLWAPEIQSGVDVSDCDDGISVHSGSVVCDRAALGHLYVGGEVGLHPWAGVVGAILPFRLVGLSGAHW